MTYDDFLLSSGSQSHFVEDACATTRSGSGSVGKVMRS